MFSDYAFGFATLQGMELTRFCYNLSLPWTVKLSKVGLQGDGPQYTFSFQLAISFISYQMCMWKDAIIGRMQATRCFDWCRKVLVYIREVWATYISPSSAYKTLHLLDPPSPW